MRGIGEPDVKEIGLLRGPCSPPLACTRGHEPDSRVPGAARRSTSLGHTLTRLKSWCCHVRHSADQVVYSSRLFTIQDKHIGLYLQARS